MCDSVTALARKLPPLKTLAKLAAGMGVLYCGWHFANHLNRRRRGDFCMVRNKEFDGDARRYICTTCTPALLENLVVHHQHWTKKVLIPSCCDRCSLSPGIRATYRECSVSVSDEIYDSINMYSTYNLPSQFADAKQVGRSLTTVIDNLNYKDRDCQLLMQIIGYICTAEHIPHTRFLLPRWSNHTTSYRLSTPWQPDQAPLPKPTASTPAAATTPSTTTPTSVGTGSTPPPPPSPPPAPPPPQSSKLVASLRLMRPYWDWVQMFKGRLPQVSRVDQPAADPNMPNYPNTVLDSHSKTDVAGKDPFHIKRTTTQMLGGGLLRTAERMGRRPMLNTTGLPLVFEARPNAIRVGPMLNKALIHNTSDSSHTVTGVEKRCLPEPGHNYDRFTPTARRLTRFMNELKEQCFTERRILASYNHLFGAKAEFKDIRMASFSKDAIQKASEQIDGHVNLRPRKANAKLEIVYKEAGENLKPVRLTYDNGVELLTMSYVITKIFQDLVYGKTNGLLYEQSIKEQSRDVVITKFMKRWMENAGDLTGVELDQTGMERHTRGSDAMPGLMTPIYQILKKICGIVNKKLHGKHAHKYQKQLVLDHKKGLCFVINHKCDAFPKGRSIKVEFDDLYLDSGWSLTSGVNFINEFSGLLCSMFLNPCKVFAKDANGKFLLLKRDRHGKCEFEWKFRTVPLNVEGKPGLNSVISEFDVGVEGDDFCGQAAKIFASPENQAIVEQNNKDLGYKGKLKFVTNGRLEFVGVHMQVANGRPSNKHMWCPDVCRSLGKLGERVGNDMTVESTVARFLSLASMYATSITPMSEAFLNSALRHITANESLLRKEVKVRDWDDLWKAGLESGTHSLLDIYNRTSEIVKNGSALTPKQQACMVGVSMSDEPGKEQVFSGKDFAKLEHFAMSLNEDLGDEQHYLLLPPCMMPNAT